MGKLTDVKLRGWLKKRPTKRSAQPDGSVSGLSIRVGPQSMTWTLKLRVTGEAGVTARGHKRKGRTHRVTLGEYPSVTLDEARGRANTYWDQAKKGISPIKALEAASTAGGLTVSDLAQVFLTDYVQMKELRSLKKYQSAVEVHIVPQVGDVLVDLLTRDQVREALKKVMVKRARGQGPKDRPRGGKEAARSTLTVLRMMISWGIDEGKITRNDNPASGMEKNLPKKRKRERVLEIDEAREAWEAATSIGYPFGPVYQLIMLTGCRPGEWSQCRRPYVHLEQALLVLPARSYKSDHVHVVPLVPAAVQILRYVMTVHPCESGDYLFSGTGGIRPLAGWTHAQNRMRQAICANTGSIARTPWTPHDLRRTVATRIAEALGVGGEQLIKRVLGHSDGSVTAIYNRYGYVKEMRTVLTQWSNDLLGNAGQVNGIDESGLNPLIRGRVVPSLTAQPA